MSSDNIQILELLKRGLTIEEVAQALSYDVEAVRTVAMFDSRLRGAIQAVESGEVAKALPSVDDLQPLAKRVIAEIAEYGDKDSVRLAAATYIRDEGLGLKRPKTASVTFNVFDFNDRLRKVKERRAELDKENVIEVPSELAVA